HWQSKKAQDQEGLDCLFEYRGGKHWVVERWKFSGGDAGINISGMDPTSGDLGLWSAGKFFTGKSGRWDDLGNQKLGQVQGNGRIVREFPDSKTFNAHWQFLQKGSFDDVKDRNYTSTRVE